PGKGFGHESRGSVGASQPCGPEGPAARRHRSDELSLVGEGDPNLGGGRMRNTVWSSLLVGALTVSSLSAQDAPNRKAFWFGFGLGRGVNLAQTLEEKSLWGGSGYLRLGGTPKPNLLLGVEAAGWTVDYRGVKLSRGNVHFTSIWYPNVASGFYLKGGIGAA